MLTATSEFAKTGLFHIYNRGMTAAFNYGDCGPNKITATANALLFYGSKLQLPLYSLHQRDQLEAADPLSMFWYTSQISGTWYHNLPVFKSFPDVRGAWVSMRSSWADPDGLFVAMKAGKLLGHQARKSFITVLLCLP